MNEEIDSAIKSIQASMEAWDDISGKYEISDDKTYIAKNLQFQLTLLKLLIGIEKFDELPTFARYLRNVTKYINKIDELEEKKCSI